jgi:succinyl-CoA synthetase beta subunit
LHFNLKELKCFGSSTFCESKLWLLILFHSLGQVYLCEKLSLTNEMYFAITLDRKSAGPLIIACSKGGTSIEDLAEKYPDWLPISLKNAAKCDKWYQLQNHSITESLNAKAQGFKSRGTWRHLCKGTKRERRSTYRS